MPTPAPPQSDLPASVDALVIGAGHNGLVAAGYLARAGPLGPVVGLGTGKTPLQGLLLGGSGTHPGGGVTGLPGRTAAERARRYLKKSG